MNSELKDFLKETKEEIDPLLLDALEDSTSKRFKNLVSYQVKTGGKRIRPALTLLSSLSVGGSKEKAIEPAKIIEIFHNYSLVIDDIIDDGEVRRNKKTTVKKYGKSVTECIGMFYATGLAELLVDLETDISLELIKAMRRVIEGELIDILQELEVKDEPYLKENYYDQVTVEDYFEMIEKKTASLIEVACRVGAMIGGGSDSEVSALADYGRFLGIAYQIQDDILDIFGDKKSFGKEIGKDIKEGKRGNLVIILTRNKLSNDDELLEIMRKESLTEGDIKRAMKIIRSTESEKEAAEIKNSYIEDAVKSINSMSSNKYVKLLKDIAEFLKVREK